MTDLVDRVETTSGADRVDVAALGELLMGRWGAARRHSRELVKRPEFQREPGLPMPEHRARVYHQLELLVENKAVHRAFPTRLGGEEDHGGNIASFEEFLIGDPSLQIKAGMQWGLFGAAIMHLGTERHHDAFLPGAMSPEPSQETT